MRLNIPAFLFAFAVPYAALAAAPSKASDAVPAYITTALNSPARKDDSADDDRRKAAAVMAFSGAKPGQKVLELVPGHGYWTRIFSGIVGSAGHVYTVWPNEMGKYSSEEPGELAGPGGHAGLCQCQSAGAARGTVECPRTRGLGVHVPELP